MQIMEKNPPKNVAEKGKIGNIPKPILPKNEWQIRPLLEKLENNGERIKAFELWLSCYTQEEISDVVGIPRQTVTDYAGSFLKKVSAESTFTESGYTPPIYNVWKKQTKTNKVGHFGNTESQWLLP